MNSVCKSLDIFCEPPTVNTISGIHVRLTSSFEVIPLATCLMYKTCHKGGSLTIRPPTNQPNDNSTQTKHAPDKPSAVTIYHCDIPSQSGQIVRPPIIVTF
jgi:hypothetical protein